MANLPHSLIWPNAASIERWLELPPGFVEALIAEDDWSFIVKAHALLEAALGHLLTVRAEPRLAHLFRGLPFHGGRHGKVSVAQELELVEPAVVGFLTRFARLRNTLVHDVRLVQFDSKQYMSQLDEREFRATADAFVGVFRELRGRQGKEARRQLAVFHIRHVLNFGVMVSLAQIHFAAHPEEQEAAQREWETGAGKFWGIFLLVLLGLAASKGKLTTSGLAEHPQPKSGAAPKARERSTK